MLRGDDSLGRYLRAREAARHLGLSTSTLAKMRVSGRGPRYLKFGRAIAYQLADLDRWAASKARQSTSQPDISS